MNDVLCNLRYVKNSEKTFTGIWIYIFLFAKKMFQTFPRPFNPTWAIWYKWIISGDTLFQSILQVKSSPRTLKSTYNLSHEKYLIAVI